MNVKLGFICLSANGDISNNAIGFQLANVMDLSGMFGYFGF